ncbi:cysteine hydrolase family protein [Adlercreutzia shanghongiae]|uniref:Isochorismatase family cysteine hydrolase n=1 Tax=Adlercreutzia shanghongiae TaxID=3111773 RepID=A0ABU6J253_9ACTN|nr:isochorismatase family cysteine hydrolase [Adlercreutzia sp. R22]MEC4295809.1 isochorismatase family cysteine hydrolase [Adlercreutzia sp. R22]
MLGDENNNDLVDLSAIDRLRCALLVIDELGDPTGTPLEPVLLPSILQTAKLTEAARKAGMPVIFTNDAHIPGIDHELALWGTHGIAGTPEAQTSPLLSPQPTDYVVEKRRYSGFFQTGLLLLLNELGVDTLICCGMDTNICVKHTVADAYFNNFNIIVVGDATATFLVGDQEEGLDYMRTCYAAKIIDTDEAVRLIEG